MGRVRSPLSLTDALGLLLLGATILLGCKPQIGDKCTTSTDCSQVGDRLCDISQPGGYCTVYNCEPKGSNAAASCPKEASCIAFGAEPSPVSGCESGLGSTLYTRTFCMKNCDNGNDCRDGFVCEDPEADERFSAVDVDGRTKVCMVAFSAAPPAGSDTGDMSGAAGASDRSDICTKTSPTPDEFPGPPGSAGGSDGTAGGGEPGSAGGSTAGSGGNGGG